MKNKVLIIVDTHFNLMLAIQLRRTLLKDSDVDVFLGRRELREVYDRGELKKVFNNSFYIDGYNHIQSFGMFLFPKQFVKKVTHMDYIQYDDIFFWNLDWVIYNYFKACRNQKVKWHIYCDATGSYLTDIPNGPPSYGNSIHGKVLEYLDRVLWGWRSFEYIEHDYYLFSPQYYIGRRSCEHIMIPPIDTNDREFINLLNEIWGYEYHTVKEKIIYLDTGEHNKKDDGVFIAVNELATAVGSENILVRPHPSTDLSTYMFKDMHIMHSDYPFELFCFNDGLKNKLLICHSSAAVLSLYVCFNMKPSVITTLSYITFNTPLADKLLQLWEIVKNQNDSVYFAHSNEELVDQAMKHVNMDNDD